MLSIGIDPGLSGAIAVIEGMEVMRVLDMPVTAKLHGSGNMVDARFLFAQLMELTSGCGALACFHIEAVNAMPKQGVTSVFGFGHTAGVIEGVVAALGGPRHYWRPQQWKKPAGISGKDKDAARTLASRLYPNAADALARKKDDGRAEAILIAHYGQLLAKGEK